MADFDLTLKSIDKGREGLNTGLDFGLPKLMNIIPGLQQGTYTIIGGETASAKSSYCLNSYLFNPYSILRANNPMGLSMKVFYYSLEIDKVSIISKAIARKLFFKHKYIVTVDDILSRGKHRISDELYKDVIETRGFFNELEDALTIFEPQNPTGIWKQVKAYMEGVGTTNTKIVNNGKKDIEIFDYYEPTNPKETVILIVDHLSILPRQLSYGVKENIDSMSSYFIALRNRYNVSVVGVQQLNRAVSSTDRLKLKRASPQLSDFKDTGNTTQDADIVLSLHNPFRMDEEDYNGFNIIKLRDRFRWLEILKHRSGIADMGIGLNFIGELGLLQELPSPELLELSGYDPYINFNKLTCLRDET